MSEKTLADEVKDALRREIAGLERLLSKKRRLLARLELEWAPGWIRELWKSNDERKNGT